MWALVEIAVCGHFGVVRHPQWAEQFLFRSSPHRNSDTLIHERMGTAESSLAESHLSRPITTEVGRQSAVLTWKARRMSKNSRKERRRKRRERRMSARCSTVSQSPEDHVLQCAAQVQQSFHRDSNHEDQIRETKYEKFIWAVIGALLGLIVLLAWGPIDEWYHRPRLEIVSATGILLANSEQRKEMINSYAVLYDPLHSCIFTAYHMTASRSVSIPWDGLEDVYWTVLLHNTGRSKLTNLNFSIDSSRASEVSVESSPNLVIDQPQSAPTLGGSQRVATIRELAAGASGTLTVRAFSGNASLSVQERSDGTAELSISNVSMPVGLQFEGSSEMKGRNAKVDFKSLLEVLREKSRLEGDSKIRIPFVRHGGFTFVGGVPASWGFSFLRVSESQACSNLPRDRNGLALAFPGTIYPTDRDRSAHTK